MSKTPKGWDAVEIPAPYASKTVRLDTRDAEVRDDSGTRIYGNSITIEVPAKPFPFKDIEELVAKCEPDSSEDRREALVQSIVRVWEEWDTVEMLLHMIRRRQDPE
jgi:hypothetical protein